MLDLAYLAKNTPTDRKEELNERNVVPSQWNSTYTILQKSLFKPKYKCVNHYLPDGHLDQTYIRKDDDNPSTISGRMHEVDDRISIHITTSILELRSQAQLYNNTYHILKTNTSSPRDSHSSTRGHLDFGATYITLRTRHRTPR